MRLPTTDRNRADLPEARPGGDDGRGAPPRGAHTVSAILPSGRTVWLEIAPPIASVSSLDDAARQAEGLAWRREGALRRLGERLGRLKETVIDDAERLEGARGRRSRALRRLLAEKTRATSRRLAKASAEYQARVRKQMAVERETVRRLRRRECWDKALLVTSLLLFSAYGEKGRPFGSNNLALTLGTLIWLVGDEVVEKIFGTGEQQSPYPLRDADVWSYIAPFGNLLAGWWLFDDLQHERFVSGLTPVPVERFRARAEPGLVHYRFRARVNLSTVVAPGLIEDFVGFRHVPAVATVASLEWTAAAAAAGARISDLQASVQGPWLFVTVRASASDAIDPATPLLKTLDVAWMLDTQRPPDTP